MNPFDFEPARDHVEEIVNRATIIALTALATLAFIVQVWAGAQS